MNLYLLSQDKNCGYDTYDSCIVCADSEEEAKTIHPYTSLFGEKKIEYVCETNLDGWAAIEFIDVKLIGIAAEGVEKGVVLASFNAG